MVIEQVPPNEQIVERLTKLEEFCTFLQRTVNDLDQVVLGQQQQIKSLEIRLTRLVAQLDRITEQSDDSPQPENEKPPHY